MKHENEIRLPNGDYFICEVGVDEEGSVTVGKNIKGEFQQMKLSTFNARAIEIASKLPQGRGGHIRRNSVSKNSIDTSL